jgi:hypothetical protein
MMDYHAATNKKSRLAVRAASRDANSDSWQCFGSQSSASPGMAAVAAALSITAAVTHERTHHHTRANRCRNQRSKCAQERKSNGPANRHASCAEIITRTVIVVIVHNMSVVMCVFHPRT